MKWASDDDSEYGDLVVRLAKENDWFKIRQRKFMIIGEDALDLLVQMAMEEHGITWS